MFGTSHFVLYREVVLSFQRLKCTSVIEKGPQSVSFIDKLFLLCPLFRVRGSTVLAKVTSDPKFHNYMVEHNEKKLGD